MRGLFALSRGHHHIVAVDDFVVGAMAQDGADLFGLVPFDLADFVGVVIGEPASEFDAVGASEPHDIAFMEVALGIDDAGGQEAAAFVFDGRARAGVEQETASRLDGQSDPTFARGDSLALGEE